jgi:hypothetical protein
MLKTLWVRHIVLTTIAKVCNTWQWHCSDLLYELNQKYPQYVCESPR